jgi:hypothetical protein
MQGHYSSIFREFYAAVSSPIDEIVCVADNQLNHTHFHCVCTKVKFEHLRMIELDK